jgi:microcystin degradation protein MlrC
MVDLATSIAIFRTYPHLDMAETGARCLPRLLSHIAGDSPPRRSATPLPHPASCAIHRGGARAGLYAMATDGAELTMGFTGGDMPDAGPAVLVHAADQGEADRGADDLFDRAAEGRGGVRRPATPADIVVSDALSRPPGKPVVIADVEDNAGGGGSSDTTGLLRALIDAGADNAILALMNDPAAAALAHATEIGGVIETGLGGRSGCDGDAPLEARFEVTALSDGKLSRSRARSIAAARRRSGRPPACASSIPRAISGSSWARSATSASTAPISGISA